MIYKSILASMQSRSVYILLNGGGGGGAHPARPRTAEEASGQPKAAERSGVAERRGRSAGPGRLRSLRLFFLDGGVGLFIQLLGLQNVCKVGLGCHVLIDCCKLLLV